jgi:hypothetical protein
MTLSTSVEATFSHVARQSRTSSSEDGTSTIDRRHIEGDYWTMTKLGEFLIYCTQLRTHPLTPSRTHQEIQSVRDRSNQPRPLMAGEATVGKVSRDVAESIGLHILSKLARDWTLGGPFATCSSAANTAMARVRLISFLEDGFTL